MKRCTFIFKHRFIFACLFFAGCSFISAESSKAPLISSTSSIDWSKALFTSDVSLNTEKAGINMPSGKNLATNIVETELPTLIKDPLLSLYVNSYQQLGDLVLDETVTLEQLSQIIDEGRKSPGVFSNGTLTLKMTHSMNLLEISSLMIKHHVPYKNAKPIEQVSSRSYTGIIIDARGALPVQGEFVSDEVYPCFFPQIWDEKMNLIYERNMGDPELEKKQGMLHYDWSDDEEKYQDRIGVDPMHIRARKVYGELRTDPVISRNDALKILTVPENLRLLREGKVVVLLDKENLIHPVSAPEKTASYYTAIRKIKQHLENNPDDGTKVQDTYKGVAVLSDLKFVADSAQLLPTELPRIKAIAVELKELLASGDYTILVEGHTADVHKPEGQMKLSVERTQTIIQELVKNGLPRSIFTYKGYGGNVPIASNDTAAGRAANRRVVITARPSKMTYTQTKD